MLAAVGVKDLCLPLCSYADLKNGNISLFDVEKYHWLVEDLLQQRKEMEIKMQLEQRNKG